MADIAKLPKKKKTITPVIEELQEETPQESQQEYQEEEVQVPVKPPKPSSVKLAPPAVKPIAKNSPIAAETLEKIRKMAAEVNERIRHLRGLGWELRHDGIYEPTPIVVKQTGVHATILIDGPFLFLNVGH